ncbi:MAG: alpha-glucan family phosphorylase [Candidatus Abyssobacteria bacterium SURF_17]|uniref:Alpha-glucan family phosphorylase n=1 Tax=Candidatus Abyssobacteria bacterium SURF_17 TaxID=2093361 RepID=A0A419EP96_9BACT|nr:MAG: alpha-glucan family phosphorylase [Candidatus Abyssubacteria bacterium SURF_17]
MTKPSNSLHERLRALAQNLWWTWHPEVIHLFTDLDPLLWRQVDHNPTAFLNRITPEQVEERAAELVLHSRINYAFRRLNEYLEKTQTWGNIHCGNLCNRPIAYFSAEFGLHESLPIYSGGLGILAGDHLKSSSDLGIPLIGIGLLYDQGYFTQLLNRDGWQGEEYVDFDIGQLPLQPVSDASGKPLIVRADTRGGFLQARVWKLQVGRVPLLLLDSNVEGNSGEDRELTSRLYGGNERVRIRQELLLGIGGARVLQALNIFPGVLHLNEGHSAFAILEEIRRVMEYDQIPFHRARRRVALYTVFTTHTPVPAGHDRFPAGLIEEHLGPFREKLGLSHDDFMALGRVNPGDKGELFCMTVLALKNSRHANGVSAIHADVSRLMWHPLWPGRPEWEVPIGHITNGVHVLSWLAPQMHQLFETRLAYDWPTRMVHPDVWDKILDIDDGELWETHQNLKMRLIRFVRRRLLQTAQRLGDQEAAQQIDQILDPDILTIGCARRFATYKRADLILSQPERLAKLISDANRPIQIIFAGKAHPRDDEGKRMLQRIAQSFTNPAFRKRIVFVENYDYNVARHLLQGVDVWLNNPRRPLEACGTSGQKVVLNGGLNFSVLDGWWNEGYDGANGFAIGHGGMHNDPNVQYQRDADYLYETLEKEIIPLYYERNATGIPHRWVVRMKAAMRSLGWRFNADRMVKDYAERFYLPAASATSVETR